MSSSNGHGNIERVITLKSSDGQTFELTEAMLVQAQAIKRLIDNDCTQSTISIPYATGKILAIIIEYTEKHFGASEKDEDLKNWDAEFIKVNQAILYELIVASNYLSIKSLMALTAHAVAEMMEGDGTPEEMQATSELVNKIRRLNKEGSDFQMFSIEILKVFLLEL